MNDHIFFKTIGEKLGVSEKSSRPKPCPVCQNKTLHFVRKILSKRTSNKWDSNFCLHCETIINDSNYYEDEIQLKKDLDWNIRVVERNRIFLNKLLKEFIKYDVKLDSIIEIGCGIGTALEFFKRRTKSNVYGYDVNSNAIEYGKKHYKIDSLYDTLFHSKLKFNEDIDLVMCISVFEHLREPRILIEEIAKFCVKNNSKAFISIPFIDASRWQEFLPKDTRIKGNFLNAGDVHVTYFSTKGFIGLVNEFGCKKYTKINAGAWIGYLLEF